VRQYINISNITTLLNKRSRFYLALHTSDVNSWHGIIWDNISTEDQKPGKSSETKWTFMAGKLPIDESSFWRQIFVILTMPTSPSFSSETMKPQKLWFAPPFRSCSGTQTILITLGSKFWQYEIFEASLGLWGDLILLHMFDMIPGMLDDGIILLELEKICSILLRVNSNTAHPIFTFEFFSCTVLIVSWPYKYSAHPKFGLYSLYKSRHTILGKNGWNVLSDF